MFLYLHGAEKSAFHLLTQASFRAATAFIPAETIPTCCLSSKVIKKNPFPLHVGSKQIFMEHNRNIVFLNTFLQKICTLNNPNCFAPFNKS